MHPADVRFVDGMVTGLGDTDEQIPFAELVHAAYFQRVQLWAAGFYRTAGLHWDAERMQGEPFKYFAYGVAASEVEVDGFTGAYRLRRVDIVHDVGDSLSPLIDLGQVEGGFVQGAGWLTLEDLRWDTGDGPPRGRLATQAASTYKLPSFSEMPEEFNVTLLEKATEDGAVYGSKAVGEPPLMLAFSVREALREAVAAFGPPGHCVDLGCPSTPEQVFWAVEARAAAAPTSRVPVDRIGGCDALDGARELRREGQRRRAGHGGRRARARAAGGRRQDGGRRPRLLGQRRRRQPRGDRVRRGPRDAQRSGARSRSCTIRLNEHARNQHGVQCCGGEVTLLLEPLRPVPAVAIFGMGHVGFELARILARRDSSCTWSTPAPSSSIERLGRRHRRRARRGARPHAGAASWCSESCPPAATC